MSILIGFWIFVPTAGLLALALGGLALMIETREARCYKLKPLKGKSARN